VSVPLRPLPALIGRSGEQARLDALLDAARSGQSGGLVVRGEPGVGKTSLLDYAVSRADEFRVLRTLGAESESDLAFSGLLELLRPVVNRAAELPEVQARALDAALGGAGEVDRFAVYAATLGVVALVAEDGPLLCVMDDAQWVDPASSDALLFTARRLADEGVVILFAARDGEATYFEGRGMPELGLAGLGSEDARRLVQESSRLPLASGVVAQLVAATGGNPLALLEIPAGLREGQRLGAEALDDPLRGGAAVERAFGARVEALSPPARHALLVAALSDTAGLAAILQAAGQDAGGLDEAEAAGLIIIEGERLRFRHPLVRSAVHSGASGGDRRAVHAALADALETVDGDRAVWHRALATVGHDEQVAAELARVAEGARRRGGAEAQARLLERAARLTRHSERRAERLLQAGLAAYHAGRADYAAALLDEALELASDSLLRADVVNGRMDVARARGEIANWLGACRDEADRVAARDPRRASRLLTQVWDYAAEHYDISGGRELVDRIVGLSGQPDDDLHVVKARAWQSMLENDVAEAGAAARRGVELGADQSTEDAIEFGEVFTYLGDCDAGRALLAPLIERFRADGSLLDLAKALMFLGNVEYRSGRLAPADAAASEAVALIAEAGLPYWECGTFADLAVIEAMLGRHADCEQHAQRSLDLAPRVGAHCQTSYAWYALGLSALTTGRVERAIEAFEHSRESFRGVPPVTCSMEADLIDAYLRAGRVDDARGLLRAYACEATRSGHELALMVVARCRAVLASDGDAEAAFEAALRLCDGSQWPLERARCHLAYGERLRRGGQRVSARRELRRALDAFERIGAAGFAERARNELGASGETARARRGDEPEQLTAQERQIALLVARGATNREAAASVFLSPKTVERHLSNAYRKLGVRSRSELARRLADQ
jgi:DNA-binding CsgD family transcriptional regulator